MSVGTDARPAMASGAPLSLLTDPRASRQPDVALLTDHDHVLGRPFEQLESGCHASTSSIDSGEFSARRPLIPAPPLKARRSPIDQTVAIQGRTPMSDQVCTARSAPTASRPRCKPDRGITVRSSPPRGPHDAARLLPLSPRTTTRRHDAARQTDGDRADHSPSSRSTPVGDHTSCCMPGLAPMPCIASHDEFPLDLVPRPRLGDSPHRRDRAGPARACFPCFRQS